MRTNSIRNKMINWAAVAMLSLLPALMIWMLACSDCLALGVSGNVSAKCITGKAKTGEEVCIEVSTRKMTVSTFIASVEYDPAELEYKGYIGTAGKKGSRVVYLTDASDDEVHLDISVEHSETDPIVGMYAIGTTDKKYAAAKPLMTLVFKARKDGAVNYKVTESTAGKDGYTSKEIEEMSEGREDHADTADGSVQIGTTEDNEARGATQSSDADADADHSGLQERNDFVVIPLMVVVACVLLACVIFVIRRDRKDD